MKAKLKWHQSLNTWVLFWTQKRLQLKPQKCCQIYCLWISLLYSETSIAATSKCNGHTSIWKQMLVFNINLKMLTMISFVFRSFLGLLSRTDLTIAVPHHCSLRLSVKSGIRTVLFMKWKIRCRNIQTKSCCSRIKILVDSHCLPFNNLSI